jgi:hypothetical protein
VAEGKLHPEVERALDMAKLKNRSLIAATFFLVTACGVQFASATEAPADPCELLPAATVSKTLGQAYGAPQASIAPRPYANTVQGTDCRYEPKGAGSRLWFRVYFDPSPSDATGLFARLKMFYSPLTPITGVGDEAYFDPAHALHARKGNVRFYLQLAGASANESQLSSLASQVAGQL